MNGLQIQGVFAPAPEPTTMIAGALRVLPLGASALRTPRQRRTAYGRSAKQFGEKPALGDGISHA